MYLSDWFIIYYIFCFQFPEEQKQKSYYLLLAIISCAHHKALPNAKHTHTRTNWIRLSLQLTGPAYTFTHTH